MNIPGLIVKSAFLVFFGVIIVGRMFFPQLAQTKLIDPVRNIPLVGKVLGVSWDKSGEIVPLLNQRSVELADKVESSDLGINEAIENTANEKDISKSISAMIESSVASRVTQLKDVPSDLLEQAQKEIRNEIYGQICTGWKEASPGGTKY